MADYTQEQIRAELIARGAIPNDEASAPPARTPQPGDNWLQNEDQNDFGFMSHPITNSMKAVHGAQDLAGGLMGSLQRAVAFGGQAVEYPTHAAYEKITGNKVPHFNVREFMGLEGDNPVDLRQTISHNPDSFLSSVGGILPAAAAGGASIPGQMVAQGLWGAVQANPDQENMGGMLPNGRITAGLEDAALTGVGGAAFKYGPALVKSAISKAGDVLNYLNPKADAAAFLKKLGKGTREENAQSLAADIQRSHDENKAQALAHKEPIYQREAKTDIYATPTTALPEGNLDKVAYYIAPGEKPTPEQLNALAKEIANYRKGYSMNGSEKNPYNIDDFTHEAGNIFKSDMNQTQIDNLEHAMSIPTRADSEFMTMADNNPKLIEGNTKELFDKFKKKPNLTNADKLQSQLGDDWAYYEGLRKQGKLEPALKPRLKQLQDMRTKLKDEMKSGLTRINPNYGSEIDQFNQKWSTNVAPYGEENFTQNIVGEGSKIRQARQENPELPFNITPDEAKTFFANPNAPGIKVANDIGQEGRNKILYNLLATDTKPEAKGLAEAIIKAKQAEGYGRYISPEMEDFAQQLLKRTKWRNRSKVIGGLLGAGLLTEGGYELGKKLF